MRDHEYVDLFVERFNRTNGTHFSVEDVKKLYSKGCLNENEIDLRYVPEKDCLFKVGQLVRVVNWGKSYSIKMNFFQDDRIDPSYKLRFAYGDRSRYERFPNDYDDYRRYIILYIKYDDTVGKLLALITDYDWMGQPPIHLIEVDSLEAIENENFKKF
jgi:hypothetical protein